MDVKMFVSNLILLFGLSVAATFAAETVVVETPMGKLRGKEVTAPNQQKFLSFTGVPYAKPPVGELRFAKPETHPPLVEVFDATKDAVYCPHPSELVTLLDLHDSKEDCLVLNVFVKNLKTEQSAASAGKKVIVFIHGGAFVVGGANDYPAGTFVTTQDVIVVAINYRLGAFGFLSTGDEAGPGNYALWDQVLALRWVKDNIAAFGGDPDDVTLAGESAGAASVSFLALSPVTRGLFTKVWPMSSTATAPYANVENPLDPALEVARATGCFGERTETIGDEVETKLTLEQSKRVINCLRNIPVEEIASFSIFTIEKARFVARVDGDLLPRRPLELLRDDAYLESIGFFDRTYLFGVDNAENVIVNAVASQTEHSINNIEGLAEEAKKDMLESFHADSVRYQASYRFGVSTPSIVEEVVNKVSNWYTRRLEGRISPEITSDLSFVVAAYDYLNVIARSKTTNAYFFYFNHYPGFMKGQHRGVAHAAELLYWTDITTERIEYLAHAGIAGDMDDDDLELKVMFSDMIGQFMKTGNPWNGLRDKLPGGWPTFDLQGNHYLDFNLKPEIRRHLHHEKRDLWLETVPAWVAQAVSTQ